jgi:hypothetical protein
MVTSPLNEITTTTDQLRNRLMVRGGGVLALFLLTITNFNYKFKYVYVLYWYLYVFYTLLAQQAHRIF